MGLFGKKGDSDDGDSNRLALFGSRSKSKSPAPPANPYAQPGAATNPYAQAKAKAYAPAAPSASGGYGDSRQGGNEGNRYSDDKSNGNSNSGYGNNRYGDEKSMNSNRYGDEKSVGNDRYGNPGGDRYGARSTGYGANRYGGQGGYGGDRYGTPNDAAPRQGGYGGLGGDSYASQQDDGNRDALFGGAKTRVQQSQRTDNPPPYDSVDQPGSQGAQGGYGGSSQGYGSSSQGYGGGGPTFQDRQLTAEEEEEEEINATKQQIRFIKQEDVASTRNALRIAQMAEETGRDTLARLGAQGEHIHNTEKNLDLAHNQNRLAEEKARELKTLNGSMFAVHVSNPLTSSSRRAARDQAIIDKHLEEREQREATRRAAYLSDQRMQKTFKDLEGTGGGAAGAPRQKNLAERAKYQFEADSEDDEMEDEIDTNLDALSGAAGRLNALARATGQEVDEQNRMLDRVSEKVMFRCSPDIAPWANCYQGDRVDLGIAANRAKLDRIH